MKKNNMQVLMVFAFLVVLQLILGKAISLDIFRGITIASRSLESSDYWKNILLQSGVIFYFYLRERRKDSVE